jgi:drug/metabolite transporter (DMT)-like permease
VDQALAVGAALGAAGVVGVGMALEHRGAGQARPRSTVHPGLLADLLRSPAWRAGWVLTLAGYGLQAVAFAAGRLVVVEPLLCVALVVALGTSGLLHRRPLTARQWLAVLVTTAAILAFTVLASPAAGRASAPIGSWLPWLAGVGALVLGAFALGPLLPPRLRALAMASAGGATFGISDALTKTVLVGVVHHGPAILASWPPYGLVLAGTLGFLCQQTAYHQSRLADAQPALSAAEPVVGALVGLTVLREHLHPVTPLGGAAEAVAAAAMLGGIVALASLADRAEAQPIRGGAARRRATQAGTVRAGTVRAGTVRVGIPSGRLGFAGSWLTLRLARRSTSGSTPSAPGPGSPPAGSSRSSGSGRSR